ncbi:MAG: DUF4474 domain-containing protein [Lachnospiraceae bacterium]|nr:DUF4474 domain-containing protein [Lachnospiraceae bacterium]
MSQHEKCSLLNKRIKSFGYCYHCHCGCFSSTLHAWQRAAGYTYLYDYMAPRFQMVFQFLPVYFDYADKTWLIEFWKGQYGINTGAEIGIYHTDRILAPHHYRTAMFEAVSEEEMLLCSFRLSDSNGDYVQIRKKHWWLTAFLTGRFSEPSTLHMENTITFPNADMLAAFTTGLQRAGYPPNAYSISGLSLTFVFFHQEEQEYGFCSRLRCRLAQRKNKLFCKLYLWVTHPFHTTEDRVLCLYYYLPFTFRKLLRFHRFHKRCHRKRRCLRRPV